VIEFLIIILAAGLLVLAVISTSSTKPQKRRRRSGASNRVGVLDREFVARKWSTISQLSQGNGSGLRDAVSEADKLLDYALKNAGVRGETMGERLKNSRGRFSNLNGIWSAHKLRNALAHEADFDLVPAQAREAIQEFEQGLKDLGAL
jgi:hypothetical protein